MTDFKSELREILDDAFQRGFHFCDDERTGECWQNDEAYKSLDDIIALFISKLPKERKNALKPGGIVISEDGNTVGINNLTSAANGGYNQCLQDIVSGIKGEK